MSDREFDVAIGVAFGAFIVLLLVGLFVRRIIIDLFKSRGW